MKIQLSLFKLLTITFLVGLSAQLKAQFNTGFIGNNETIYEIHLDDCAADQTGLYAAIRENGNDDLLVFGQYDMNAGPTAVNAVETYPDVNVTGHFNIAPHVEILQLEDAGGNCDGFVIAISVQTAPSGGYTLQILQLDALGNFLGAFDIFDNGSSQYCYDLKQNAAGNVIGIGSSTSSGLEELMVFELGYPGLFTYVNGPYSYSLDAEPDGAPDFSKGLDIIQVSNPGAVNQYVCTGTSGRSAFVLGLDLALNAQDVRYYDFDNNPSTLTEGIAIMENPNAMPASQFILVGNTQRNDGLGNTPSKGFIVGLDADESAGTFLSHLWDYSIEMPIESTVISDAEFNNGVTYVTGFLDTGIDDFFNLNAQQFVLGADEFGVIWATSHDFNLEESRPYDIDIDAQSGELHFAGATWSSTNSPVSRMQLTKTDSFGNGAIDCYQDVEYVNEPLAEVITNQPASQFIITNLGAGMIYNLSVDNLEALQCSPPIACDFTWTANCFDVTLTASGSYPSGTTFQWDVNCNSTTDGSGQTYTHTFAPSPSPGTYCVRLTAIPAGGGAPCVVQQQVTVQDILAPVIANCPAGLTTLQADANCQAFFDPMLMVSDNCDLAPTLSCITSPGSSGSGGIFNAGITTVTCTATDASGNTSTCSYTVDVQDTTPPTIICPNDTTVTGNSCDNGANVFFTLPQFNDNCPPPSLTLSHQPGDLFPCGTTTVTATVVDQWGATDQCTFDVIVLCECPQIEFVSISCDTVNGPNVYQLCFDLFNPSSAQTLTQVNLSATGINISPNPFSVNVGPGVTTQYCIDLQDVSGLPTPRNITLGLGYTLGMDTCCTDNLVVQLPNCCDPCEQPWYSFTPDSLYADSCCYEMDLIVTCPNSMTKVVVESITPGAMIGSASLGGSAAPDWTIGTRVPQWVSFDHTSGPTAPVGTYTDLINFCIDDTTNTNTQIGLVFYYFGQGVFGDSLMCADTAYVDCAKEQRCLSILDSDVYCDSLGNYLFDYTIQNTSNPAFTANNINIALVSASGPIGISPNIVNVPPLNPGATHSGTLQIIGTALPGMNMKLNFSMHGGGVAGRDTCCWEDSTLCAIIPPCLDCCSDSTGFYQATSAPFTSTYGICDTAFVSLSYADSCIYTDIDWGDGSTLQSHVGPFSTNYTYSSAGTYVVCRTFKESSDGGLSFCWSRSFCDTLVIAPCPSSITPCDDVFLTDTMTFNGWAAVTCYSGGVANDPTFGIKDVRGHQSAPLGSNSTVNTVGPAYIWPIGWSQRTIGDVFGLAVDHRGDYYVSSFGLYAVSNPPGPSQFPYGQGVNNPSVYRINPHNGTHQVLHTFPQSPDPAFDNQKPGLGNLAHNYVNDVIYVSNLEDGQIHTLPVAGGAPIGAWSPGAPNSSGFAPLGSRIFGIGYNHVEERLYYGLWNTDWASITYGISIPYPRNQIYSVAIHPLTGEPVGAPTLEFDMPFLPGKSYSNPVSDISFDSSGKRMLISERTISPYDYNISPTTLFSPRRLSSHAHQSRNLEYISPSTSSSFTGTYAPEPAGKFGGVPGNNHSAGGNDYLYGDSLFMECDSAVVFMSDNMKPSSGQWLFGLRGQTANGGARQQSWMVDLDGDLSTYVKRELGDVEVLRDLCCGQEEVTVCDSTIWGGFDIVLDTMNCVPGLLPDIAVTPVIGTTIPDWIDFDWSCDGVDVTQTGPTYVPEIWNNTGNFNLVVCVTGYWILNGDTCDVQIIRDIDIDLCPPLPTDSTACCDDLFLYGDAQDNRVDRVKFYNGNRYVSHNIMLANGDAYGVMTKFNPDGSAAWETRIDTSSMILDFIMDNQGDILAVGRTMPVRVQGVGAWMNNQSLVLKLNDTDGSVAWSRMYLGDGREAFYNIILHPNPNDPSRPYYIGGIENHDANVCASNSGPNSANDEFHLYRMDNNGNMDIETVYQYNGLGCSYDDQWTGMTGLSNGNILIVGDYDCNIRRAVALELDGSTGAVVNTAKESNIPLRFFDAVELSTGNYALVGNYNYAAPIQGAVVILDQNLDYVTSLRYGANTIGRITEIEVHDNDTIYGVSQSTQNGLPIILKWVVEIGGSGSLEVTPVDAKYFRDQELSFASPNLYITPGMNRLHYADSRIRGAGNNPEYGSFDIIHGSFGLSLMDSCLVDTILPAMENPFDMVASTATWIVDSLASPGQVPDQPIFMMSDTLCSSSLGTGLLSLHKLPGLSIFPNPSQGQVTIDYELPYTYRVYTSHGELIKSDFEMSAGLKRLDIGNHPVGVYVIEVQSEYGVRTEPLIILK